MAENPQLRDVLERSLTVKARGRKAGAKLARDTVRSHARAWTLAQDWLIATGKSTVTPWSSETLAEFAVHLLERGYRASSVDTYLSGVRAHHRNRGWPVPDGVAAWYVLRAAKNTADEGDKVNTLRPRRAQLADAVGYLDPARNADLRDLCLVALAWDLMCTLKDLVALDVKDVRTVEGLDGESGLSVRVGGRWVSVEHLHEPLHVCPVDATLAWLRRLWAYKVEGGALFRPVDQVGRIGGTPGWSGTGDGLRLRIVGVHHIWKQAIATGELGDMGPGDIRMASAVEAVQAGVPVEDVLERGGWSESSGVALRLYVASRGAGEVSDGGA